MLRTFAVIVFAHPYCARNSWRNVTPRHALSVRAEKSFQTNIGLEAVSITLLTVYSLKWSVTPNFLLTGSFALPFSSNCKEMNKKSMWEVYKLLIFLPTRHQILPIFQLTGECKCDHQTIRFSKGTSPVESICLLYPLKQYLDKKIAFHEFIRIIFGQTDTLAIVRNEGRFIRSLGDLSDILSPKRIR